MIAGIIVGSFAGVLVVGVIFRCFLKRARRNIKDGGNYAEQPTKTVVET
jgi:hypothetical protein